MKRPEKCQWNAMEYDDGTHPPGLWIAAGRILDNYGLILGGLNGPEEFVPEFLIEELIADMDAQEDAHLIALIQTARGRLADVHAGRSRFVCDAQGEWQRKL